MEFGLISPEKCRKLRPKIEGDMKKMKLSELRKKPHLSASSVNKYMDCSLAYKFSKIDKIPWEYKSDALELGSVIHKVIEMYYRQKMIGKRLSLVDIHKLFEKMWFAALEKNPAIQFGKGRTPASALEQGKELLSVWYENLPDDDFQIIAIEEAFQFYMDGIDIPFIGAMDLVEEDNSGTIIITDFKTSAKAYSASEVDKNLQLTLYKMAAQSNGYKGREILLKFDCLIKTKTPKFEQYYTTRSEMDEIRAMKKIQQVYDGIQKGVFIPNDGSWKCINCSYKRACIQWFKGGESNAKTGD